MTLPRESTPMSGHTCSTVELSGPSSMVPPPCSGSGTFILALL